jgi:hypothetical protein
VKSEKKAIPSGSLPTTMASQLPAAITASAIRRQSTDEAPKASLLGFDIPAPIKEALVEEAKAIEINQAPTPEVVAVSQSPAPDVESTIAS